MKIPLRCSTEGAAVLDVVLNTGPPPTTRRHEPDGENASVGPTNSVAPPSASPESQNPSRSEPTA
jgi:hypothetical protein